MSTTFRCYVHFCTIVNTNRIIIFFFCTDSADAYSLYRSVKKSDEDIPVPPLIKSAALWGTVLISPLLSLRCIFIDWKYSNMV
jgi:hypothetical protein